jgi:hypothetical protein
MQIPRKEYIITIPTQLNISNNQYFPSPDDINTSTIEFWQENSHIFNTSANSSDVESIFRLVEQYWATHGMDPASGHWTVQTPLTISVSTLNLTEESELFVNLTVESAYNMTLYYNPFMTFLWSRISGCDNQTLDGLPVETIMPYFTQDSLVRSENSTVLAGTFLTEKSVLNDSVSVAKKSLGVGLKPGTGSIASTAFVFLGLIFFAGVLL